MREKHKCKAVFEIFILVMASIAFAYIVHESISIGQKIPDVKKNVLPIVLGIIGNLIFDKLKSVSALDMGALSTGAYTCVRGKDGSFCQSWIASSCDANCDGACIPTTINNVGECKPGTCYDKVEGTCQAGSPKVNCEANGGQWIDNRYENVAQCKRGCCVLGDQTAFVTERQCFRQGAVLGVDEIFKPEVRTELECLALARTQEKGACVFETISGGLPERNCNFVTSKKCLETRGEFYAGKLCSNPELKTICVKQARAGCVEGENEVYWFDSCGNRENIYDANKVNSWNNGNVLAKSDSCSLISGNNLLANQKTCGNCNSLLGSICGRRTLSEKMADNGVDVVCRDLSCVDSDGKKRKNGESWCVYQGAVGVESDNSRSRDTPGSRHFRQVCLDGEVRTESCGEYRNGICVESRMPLPDGKDFASASCRLNRWQECLNYNTLSENDPDLAMEECKKNSDCFVKSVNIDDDGFKFKVCAPKYAPGLDVEGNPDGARMICATASQKCKMTDVKNWKGEWECKMNCDCKDNKFAEQMNDFCMSLGDCGASVNYIGEYSRSYRVTGNFNPDLGSSYLGTIKKYDEIISGEYIIANATEILALMASSGMLGVTNGVGEAGEYKNEDVESAENWALGTSGAMGGILVAGAYAANLVGSGAITQFFLGASTVAAKLGLPGLLPISGSAIAPYGGAAIGAAIGMAVVALLIKYLGIGPGLTPAVAGVLLAAGAVGGLIIGIGVVSKLGGGACAVGGPVTCVVGAIIVIVVVIIIGIMKAFGVGKTRTKYVAFSCRPWQAPFGGKDCSKCGDDGLGCSRYACSSLGQTCKLINEGTGNEECVDINPNDVISPVINPLRNVNSSETEYKDVSGMGFKLVSKEGDGCVKEYQELVFGLETNEPAQCKYEFEHTNDYENMKNEMSDGLFLYEHNILRRAPSLTELGLSGFEPTRRGDVQLYIRCVDKNENKNINEYVVQFCVKPAEDVTPPVIRAREPVIEVVAFNATILNGGVYTNEPAECRWSGINQDYELMNNTFVCLNDFEHETFNGFKCQTTFPVLNNSVSYYVRCKDQPWLEGSGNENKQNKNSNSYEFKMRRSTSELKIAKIEPDEKELVFGVEPASVVVRVETAGGLDGKAECKYKIGDNWINFFSTFGTTHTQNFQNFLSGSKILPIQCMDAAGNAAEKTARFNITIDTAAPIVTRVYQTASSLVVITNENSICYYGNLDCLFKPINGTEMLGAGLVHTTPMEEDKTYYVKCKDGFDNYISDCNAVVKGGS